MTLGQGQDYIYEGKLDFRGRHHRDSLGLSSLQKELFKLEQVYQIFPEYYILRVNQFYNVTRNSLDEWIYFLKNSEIKEEFQARGLAEAKDKLRIESLPLPEKVAYQNYLENKRYEISLLEGAEAAGKLQGRAEKAIEIAKAMKARGIDINLIVETTGLTKEDVEHF